MGTFTREEGNIFLYAGKVDYIVNANNSLGTMGAGLALQFLREKNYAAHCMIYNSLSKRVQNEDNYREIYSAGIKRTVDGRVYDLLKPIKFGEPKAKDAMICFASKIHWRPDSEMEFIERGFEILNEDEENEGLTFAMPLLGGGLGGLDPDEVRAKMKELTEKSRFNVILVEFV